MAFAHNLEIVSQDKYTHIRAVAKDSPEDIKSMFRDVKRLHDQGKTKKLLLDTSQLDSALSVIDRYSLVLLMEELGFTAIDKFARVVKSTVDDDLNFMKTAAHNRGINIQFFDNESDAVNWLMKN